MCFLLNLSRPLLFLEILLTKKVCTASNAKIWNWEFFIRFWIVKTKRTPALHPFFSSPIFSQPLHKECVMLPILPLNDLDGGLPILAIMDEVRGIYKLALLSLHIPEFIIIKEEKCFSTKGTGTMVIDTIIMLRYTDRHVSIWSFVSIFICPRYAIFWFSGWRMFWNTFAYSWTVGCIHVFLFS